MKDGLSYATTLMIVGVSFLSINEVLTVLVLLATLVYWVLKMVFMYKRHKREESKFKEECTCEGKECK